jgi:hypothetical protein
MAAKNTKDSKESEPISIDTTILKINIKTTGDLKTKDYDLLPFHPNMSDLRDLSNNSYILFPSFVKITMKDLQKAGVGSDYPNVFMNLDKYIKLIRYVTDPNKEEDNTLLTNKSQVKNYTMSLAQNALTDLMSDSQVDTIAIQKDEHLTDEEIITNNIELIKSLFLAAQTHFFILGNDYVIGKSNYIPPYLASNEKNERLSSEVKKIPLNYTITIELQLLDAANNPEAGDFMKMTCKAKKGNIAKEMKDIFGYNFGYVPEARSSIPSILNTSEATKNRQFGKLQYEWEKRNKYVKAPANERERLALEKNWTPLQRKMAEYDKQQEAFDKIPPQWIKAREELEKKYGNLTTELVKMWGEMKDIKDSNAGKPDGDSFLRDQLDSVRTKMYRSIEPFLNLKKTIPTVEEMKAHRAAADGLQPAEITLNELRLKLAEYTKTKTELEEKQAAKTEEGILSNYERELNEFAEQISRLKGVDNFLKTLEPATTAGEAETAIKGDIAKKDGFLGRIRDTEKETIDDKYTQALFEGTKHGELEGDIKALEKEENEIYEKLKKADPYNATGIKAELSKLQATIRKKKADIGVLNRKYNKTELIRKWEETLKKMNAIKSTIDSEKNKSEKTIANKTVKDETAKLFKEIKKLKEEYLTAAYKEGKEVDLTQEEKSKFEKADRPIDTSDDIKANMDTLKSQYFDVAKKLGFNNELQGEITLLNDELSHYKKIREEKEKDRKPIDTKLSSIVNDKAKAKGDQPTLDKLDNETTENTKKLNKIQRPLNKMTKLIEKYEKYIKKIKLLKTSEELISAKKIFEEELEKIQTDAKKKEEEGKKEEEEYEKKKEEEYEAKKKADEQKKAEEDEKKANEQEKSKTGGNKTRKRKNKQNHKTKRSSRHYKKRTLRGKKQRRRKYTK